MQVRIVTNAQNTHRKRIESAVSLINGCQHYFHLQFHPDETIARQNATVDPVALCKQAEKQWPNEQPIVITEDPFDDNWFSHEYRASSVITTADWEATFAPPSLRAYMMYQIAQGLIHFAADLSEEMALNFVHEPPVGCVYDLATHKPDIKLGMVAGNVCHQCVGQLRALGTDDAAVESVIRIVSLVRAELKLLESGKKMCLAPIAAGGTLGVAQLGQGHYVAAILSVGTGSVMTLILLGSVAVGSLLVGRVAQRRRR